MKLIILTISLLMGVVLSIPNAVRADVYELGFRVETGGFMGYWRFANRREGDTIGGYSCDKTPTLHVIELEGVRWYHGDCVVDIKPASSERSEFATFELRGLHAIVDLQIGGDQHIAFDDPLRPSPSIRLAPNDTGGVVTINSAAISVEPNGFTGICGFEYILNENGLNRNSCDGEPTLIPLGTTFQLFAAGRDANPVHISHLGVPYPEGNGRVYRHNNSTIAFRTIDVRIAFAPDTLWHIEGVTPPQQWLTGTQTLRLVNENLYNLTVMTKKGEHSNALIKLEPRCGAPAQTVLIGGHGLVYFTQICRNP